MTDQPESRPAVPATDGEDDVEGHAFKWEVVADPKSGDRKLRAGWTPDEPTKPSVPQRNPKQG
jgi:hypothetical protein